jgi:hypothetical protein
MDPKARYTEFPNLYGTVQSRYAPATLQIVWPVSLAPELLISSWSTLLRLYTNITEPVFSLEGRPIKVSAASGSWNEVEVEDADGRDGHHTSITLNKVSLQEASQQVDN